MAKELSFTEQLCYITTRIVTTDADNNTHVATGFFSSFAVDEQQDITVLVTNRHVAEDAETMVIWLTEKNSEGDPVDNSIIKVTISNANKGFLYHPDPNVDLAIYIIGPAIQAVEKQVKKKIFYKKLPFNLLLTDRKALELDAVENVIMIGYPRGLWDESNNRPIFRYGITATDPKVDYDNNREFMIDCACIHGSSGSPVLLFYKGVFSNKYAKETQFDSLKAILLGVQYAIPLRQTEGKIVKPRGNSGFGYDSCFEINVLGRTYGEISEDEKNEVSHRLKATKLMTDYLKIIE